MRKRWINMHLGKKTVKRQQKDGKRTVKGRQKDELKRREHNTNRRGYKKKVCQTFLTHPRFPILCVMKM